MTINGFPRVDNTVPRSGNPQVDPVTGALSLEAMDYGQRDLGETFLLVRAYVSGRTADDLANSQPLGRRWGLEFGGRLVRNGTRLRLPVGAFRWEAFFFREGHWEHADGDERYRLREKKDGFVLRDIRMPAEYVYDAGGHLVSVQRRGGMRRQVLYYGNTPTMIVLSSGQELRLGFLGDHLADVEDGMGRRLCYQYDGGGLLTKVTYPNNSSVRYDYDEMGRLHRMIDCNGRQEFLLFYDEQGRVVKREMRNGGQYTYQYLDQEQRTVIMDGASMEYRTYYWNRKGQIERLVHEDGREERLGYDGTGRLVYRRDCLGRETRREYDSRGLLVREYRPGDWVLDYVYDEVGRLVQKRDNFDGVEQYEWNGNGWLSGKRTRLTGKAWREERWERDMMGRILSYSCNGHRTRYAYEEYAPLPHLMELPCGDKFSYRYDKMFRLRAVHSFVGDRLFGYNVLDLVASEEDAMKNKWEYHYDLQGEPTDGKTAPFPDFPGNPGTKFVIKTEDEAYKDKDDLSCIHDAKGRLTEVYRKEDHALLARFGYDIAGRKTEERKAEDGADGFRLRRWKYDDSDNIVEERIWLEPQDETSTRGRIRILRYEHDAQSRLIRMEDNSGESREYSYDGLSRCIMTKFRGKDRPAEVTKYLYDAAGRLIGREEKSDYARTGRLWERTSFSLDAEGRCLAAILPGGEGQEGEDAEKTYSACMASLPRYEDGSGYCRCCTGNIGMG